MVGEVMQAAAGNPITSAINSALNAGVQYFTSRRLAKYNYELGQKSLRNSPSSYKKGLIRAGINPILASGSPIGATQGSAGVNPGLDLVGDMVKGNSAKNLTDQTKSNIDLQEKQGDAAIKQADAAKLNAEASMKNAQTNEKMLTINGVNAGANAVGTVGGLVRDGATVFTTVKGGKVPTSGTSAKGLKGAVSVPASSSAGSVSKGAKVLSNAGLALTPTIIPAALAAAAGTAAIMKKAQDTAEKHNTESYKQYRSFTHHASAGW